MDQSSQLAIPHHITDEKILRISAKNQQLGELQTKISKFFASDLITGSPAYPYLSQS